MYMKVLSIILVCLIFILLVHLVHKLGRYIGRKQYEKELAALDDEIERELNARK